MQQPLEKRPMRPWIATQLAASALRALLNKIAKYALLHFISRSAVTDLPKLKPPKYN
jgi:hypothetical protein